VWVDGWGGGLSVRLVLWGGFRTPTPPRSLSHVPCWRWRRMRCAPCLQGRVIVCGGVTGGAAVSPTALFSPQPGFFHPLFFAPLCAFFSGRPPERVRAPPCAAYDHRRVSFNPLPPPPIHIPPSLLSAFGARCQPHSPPSPSCFPFHSPSHPHPVLPPIEGRRGGAIQRAGLELRGWVGCAFARVCPRVWCGAVGVPKKKKKMKENGLFARGRAVFVYPTRCACA
jgi:hypothetical protein